MDINSKRRRKIDNPYLLNKDKEKEIYVVSFKDGQGIYREVPVQKKFMKQWTNLNYMICLSLMNMTDTQNIL